MHSARRWFSLFLALVAAPGSAAEIPEAVTVLVHSLFPGHEADRVAPASMSGFYEVSFGARVFYVSEDGRYVVNGDIIDIQRGVNLSEEARTQARAGMVASIDEAGLIVFPADGAARERITVFTDVTCPFCSRLHLEVPKLNASGIEVRYAAFPRAGIPSEIYDQMMAVWCADDQRQAMTDAKAGLAVEARSCPTPIAQHYETGQRMGVSGTPAIVLDDGTLIGGYLPADELIARLALDGG